MSSSNCCFLTCIQVFQEAGQVVWYSHLFQNFPQFIVIHTVEGFGIVNKAEIDVFLELPCFFDDPADIGNLISGSSAFSKTSLNIWKFMSLLCLKPPGVSQLNAKCSPHGFWSLLWAAPRYLCTLILPTAPPACSALSHWPPFQACSCFVVPYHWNSLLPYI